MEKLYFIACVIVFLTVTLRECHGEDLVDPDHGKSAIPDVNAPEAEKLPHVLERIKVLSGQLVPRNGNEEKNPADHISVDKKIKPDDEKHSESSGVIGHVEVHDDKGIAPPEANHEDLSRVPRQSPSNSAAYQERLQQQIRDNPEQAQKIKEMQADAQSRYQQALDSERAKNMQGQMTSRKEEFGDSELGQKMKEGGMKKSKQRKGKGGKGKGKERKKGSRKGSGGGKKKEKGERKSKLKSGQKKGKGDREGKKKKKDKDRTRGHGGTKGQAPAVASM